MPEYYISVFNDMGHIMTEPHMDKLPVHINKFVFDRVLRYLQMATDNKDLGCRFYILQNGLQKKWTYNYRDDIITINWNVNTFNQDNMRWI
jgi:uncharacterized lipoprotein YehR (DUF1307 family)